MVRVGNLVDAMDFFSDKLGFVETRRYEYPDRRMTVIFIAAPEDLAHARERMTGEIEIVHYWDVEEYSGGRNFGHVAYGVADIYAVCQRLMAKGVAIVRPPRDGQIAFIRSPDGISVEFLQDGGALPPQEPWASMPDAGTW
jgi:lactoylglutathione lyase